MALQRKTKSTSRSMNKRKITPEDLLKFHFVGDPQISPNGDFILFTKKHIGRKNEYVTNLHVVSTEKGSPRQFTAGEKDSHGRWSPDGNAIAFISNRDESHPQIFTIPASGGEATSLTNFPEGSISSFKWSPDGTMLAVSFRETDPDWTEEAKQNREKTGASLPARVIDDMYYRLDGDGYFNSQRFHLHIVDISTGEHRVLFDRDTIGWFNYDWSPNSRELVVSTNTDNNALVKFWKWDLYRVSVETGKSKKIPNLPIGVKSIVAWSPNGKQIAYCSRAGKECWGVNNTHLYVCDINGGNVRNLTEHSDYCLSAVTLSDTSEATFDEKILYSPDGKRIIMNFGWQGGTQIASIDANGGDVLFHTKDRKSVSMGNISADGLQLAMTVGDQTTLAEVAVGRLASSAGTGSLRISKRSQFNKSLLAELELSQAESQWIPSEDGTKVHVWVMKPVGFKPGKRYPAILEVHGGPHTQYGEAFFHEFQVLAAAGYAIVYSNPRGSKGYGEKHCTAIKGDWGNADWKDIQAVTAFMKQLPFVNEKKMGVSGGSYGGYMTNWVIGHTDEFAAAITDRCVSNLVSMVGSSDLPLVPGEYWRGNSWDNTETIWEQSPLKHFGNVTTPTLVIHSEGDLRCNVEQGEQVFAALKLRGIPTRFVRYPSTTSHGLSRCGPPDLRLHRLGQYLGWWKKYLN